MEASILELGSDFTVVARQKRIAIDNEDIKSICFSIIAAFTNREHKLKSHGVAIGMDGKGRAIDNVMIERLWRTLKYEEVYLKEYRTGTDPYKGIAT